MNKKDVVRVLEEIATLLEIKGENPFRISAYKKAAQALEKDRRTLTEIDEPTTIAGIGAGTAAIIEQLKEKGEATIHNELLEEIPQSLLSLLHIPGLGGKRIGRLYRELQIVDISSLQKACEQNKVQTLSGFGKKTEANILQAIEEIKTRPNRIALPHILPLVYLIEEQLQQIKHIENFSRAGSLRRMQETVKDIDFIIATTNPDAVRSALVSLPFVKKVIASGETKVTVETNEIQYPVSLDFRLVSPTAYATTLHHFTGSKEHNVKMRQLAKKRGEKISEYGVLDLQTEKLTTFSSEEQFFNHFDLEYIPPEVRENNGEVTLFSKSNEPPTYIKTEHIRGDLHMHTTWSDGAHSIREMAEAAKERGYEYIAITDHSQFLQVANGLTPKEWFKQREQIQALNEKGDGLTIFTGIEMDILPDGRLDYDDSLLREMDFVIAAIHSSFQQDEETIKRRLNAAFENDYVRLIAHPTGRLLGRRKGYEVDLEWLVERARETNTALEMNANPHRLDLHAEALQLAKEKNVYISINTDAHRLDTLSHMDYGTALARKALYPPHLIINTWPLQKIKQFLHRS